MPGRLVPTPEERIAVLETKLELVADQLSNVVTRLDRVTAILEQARGARWIILGLLALVGFIGAKFEAIWGLLSNR